MNFKAEQAQKIRHIEAILTGFLPVEEGFPKIVAEAMNYSILAGGKRIRPMLLLETYRLMGGPLAEEEKICHPFMAALEMIHTYSLVHDDLPMLDDDEYRRGRKTTHMVYGEAFALLAGDGLLNLAFETAFQAFDRTAIGTDLPEGIDSATAGETMRRVAAALKVLAGKAGIGGMIGGQTADILAEKNGEPPTEALLSYIHGHKTAALFQSAMMIGGILAGGNQRQIEQLEQAADNIGVAFQIQDDILDVTGTFADLGKPIGSDDKNQKLTYVSLRGMEKAQQEVARMSGETIEILRSFPGEKEFLLQLVEAMIHRNK